MRVFTQEDPIGYAGGINLYAYVGNNPVLYSDPFGLKACDPPDDPECEEDKVADVRVGLTAGGKYEIKVLGFHFRAFGGASATGGLAQTTPTAGDGSEYSNGTVGAAQVGAELTLTYRGVGFDERIGPCVGDCGDPVRTTPVEGDGTVRVSGTIPLAPGFGVQVEAELNVPAAFRRLGSFFRGLFN